MALTDDTVLDANQLLRSLPADERDAVGGILEAVDLELRDEVYTVGEPISAVYFPVDAVFSMLTPMDDGRAVEIATVGHEGFVGVPVFLQSGFSSSHMTFCQIGGAALRAEAHRFMDRAAGLPHLHAVLHRYTQALLAQVAQASACNRLHSLEQRCARWLLLTHDRVGRDEFPLTQDFLSQMLGVRRAGVNEAQRQIQDAGAISYVRGIVTVLDRGELERLSCECYPVIRAEHDRVTDFGS